MTRIVLLLLALLLFAQAPFALNLSKFSDCDSLTPMGAHLNQTGASFRVWAPGAESVMLLGDFNNNALIPLKRDSESLGTFCAQVSDAKAGDRYFFQMNNGVRNFSRFDTFAEQVTPNNSSNVLTNPGSFQWSDQNYRQPALDSSVIYELHVGSFNPPGPGKWGSFQSVGQKIQYLSQLGVRFIELLPIQKSAQTFDWGYGVSLPDTLENSYGAPDELRELINLAHQAGIGVFFDVVHNHYSSESALVCFDGICPQTNGIYFYSGPQGITRWGPRPNFGKPQVAALISNSIFRMINEFHADGFRWDAVPYITQFIDYDISTDTDINDGINLEGISLLRSINSQIRKSQKAYSIAEYFGEDPIITAPPSQGGLGFDAHWTGFFAISSAITQKNLSKINLLEVAKSLQQKSDRVIFTESHDEVGHPPRQRRIPTLVDSKDPTSFAARKRSLLGAVLVMTSPGIPMIFQGQEFLEDQDFLFPHGTPLNWGKANQFSVILSAYRDLIALRENRSGESSAFSSSRIQILQLDDDTKVLAFRRWSDNDPKEFVVVVNFSDQAFPNYSINLPAPGSWNLKFSSDRKTYSTDFGDWPRANSVRTKSLRAGNGLYSANVELAPFTAIILQQ